MSQIVGITSRIVVIVTLLKKAEQVTQFSQLMIKREGPRPLWVVPSPGLLALGSIRKQTEETMGS